LRSDVAALLLALPTAQYGRFTRDAIAQRKRIQALLGKAQKLLEEMK
jgi:hypothetical protein